MPVTRANNKAAATVRSSSSGSTAGYFTESLKPMYSAWLVLPFLLIYEIGLLLFRSDVINGGDAIVINLGAPLFHRIGVEGAAISMACLLIGFIVWQIHRGGSWKVHSPVLVMMGFESLFYALTLFLLLGFFVQHLSFGPPDGERRKAELRVGETNRPPADSPTRRLAVSPPLCATSVVPGKPSARDFVLYCGAGVFEELVFRVLLLGLLMLVLTRLLHMEHAYAAAWAVLLGAVIFSAFHHFGLGGGGERFQLNVFLQRLLAGLYFSALYFNRGFGVAAASHAFYDIMVGLNQLR